MASSQVEPRIADIVIVGRPNVGKSTLFNRIVGRRRAITDPTPGVTRDPVAADGNLAGKRVRVTDTGGYTVDSDDLARAISGRALQAVARADVVLLVVDGTDLTALDEEFVQTLRPYQEKTVVVVNKLDSEERENLLYEFYGLGIPRVTGVSAAHGRGMDELSRTVAELLDATHDSPDVPRADESRVSMAILGQPNTGKSTLVNRLTSSSNSLVSEVPGTTRDVIEGDFGWDGQPVRILDTAGIRRKSKVSENIEYYSVTRAIDTIEDAEVVVLLIDADKGLSDQDKKIAALVVNKGRGIVIGLNKWDLLPKVGNQFEAIRDRILFLFPVLSFAPIVPLSAQTGKGVPELMKQVMKVQQQLHHRIDTGVLNRHLEGWLERTPPPVRGKGRLKVRYMTQVSVNPVIFVGFVNRKKVFPESYVGYLKNQIRADFGLSSIPFRLELRER